MNNSEIVTPWGSSGYFTFKRTYARRLNEADPNSATEEFEDAVDRVIKATKTQLKVGFTEEELVDVKNMFLGLEGSVAGRFWWQLGTKTVDKLGLLSLQNCASTVVNHPITPFTWAMDALMLGSGVGYNIQREHVYELPKPKKVKITRLDTSDADYIVPDSRQGWVELLHRVLESHFITGKSFTYSTICIRGKGTPIKGFGGLASGPEELCWGMTEISKLLNSRANKKVRSIDCLDIMNIIGYIVVSGNVRRSAQIAIGDYDDFQFLNAKRWDLGNIPSWRAMSNNSVVCDDISKLPNQFWEGYLGNGEPYGLINLKSSRAMGRTGDFDRPDHGVMAYNPCQPEFATVLTPEGVKQFKDIGIGSKIWSKQGWTTVVNKWSTGIKPVYNFRTSGGVFVGTENHRVDTREGKVEVGEAEEILTIAGNIPTDATIIPTIVMDGLFLGDGYNKKMKGRGYVYPSLVVGYNDNDYFNSEVKDLFISKLQDRSDYACSEYRIKTSVTVEEKTKTYELEIPERFYLKDANTTISLLRGLYSADGNVIKQAGNSVRVTYKTASKVLAQQVQQMLSSVGIRSYITTNKQKSVEFKNGIYPCKESYDVNITKDFPLFYKNIGFIQKYKMDKIAQVIDTYIPSNGDTYTTKKEVEYLGDFEVFDITVDNSSHTYWTGGLSVSNCAEQSLEPYETCCLAEIFLPNIKSLDRLKTVASYLYRINKHSLILPCHLKETEEIVHKNMRMGIGVTGYLQASEEQKAWLPEVYKYLRQLDVEYSAKHGFNQSIKLTTVKPSGTLSLLAGVTSGAHPAFSQYYIRRIRVASNSNLIPVCKSAGYPIEFQRNFDGSEDRSTMIVSFPTKVPEGTVLAKNMTAIDQLEVITRLQREWSDNSVSVTIYYRKEELEDIKSWLSKNYSAAVKTVSFLLHSDHGFQQAPMEEITKEAYEELASKITAIGKVSFKEDDIIGDSSDCLQGVCPIK